MRVKSSEETPLSRACLPQVTGEISERDPASELQDRDEELSPAVQTAVANRWHLDLLPHIPSPDLPTREEEEEEVPFLKSGDL